MRIVHVSDCFLPMMGGIEMQVAHLAEQQSRLGHQVTVMTCAAPSAIEEAAAPYRVMRSVWLGNPLGAPIDPRAPGRFVRAIERIQPDVVHLHLGELTPVVQGVIWRLRDGRVPVVVTVHSVWSEGLTVPTYRLAARALTDSPVAWTGVSQLVAGLVGRVVGPSNVRVLPNGVDGSAWRVEPIQHEGLVAVTAARFAPRKRIHELLEMIDQVRRLVPPGSFRAVLAGQGPGFAQAQRFVADHDLGQVVALPGRLTPGELRRLYSESDVFVSPSVREAASIAAAEAQAAGLAILSRSQSGLGERITRQEGAVADTDAGMVDVLREWALDPSLVAPLKAHNLATVCPLDWSVTLPRTEDAYAWAAARARR